ncbi:hypothetical protein HYX17_02515 [Candidatus Woesearchaeota archaeon]|nr:hypothetical protein [Candidatus Woesearchaeota archaeon]
MEDDNAFDLRREFKSSTQQGILMRMAKAYSDTSGTGYLILYEVIAMLRGKLGDDPLKKVWKEKYDIKIKKLRKVGIILSELNFYLFQLDDRKLRKEIDVTSPYVIKYRNLFAKSSLYIDIIYEAFYILLNETKKLKHMDIPNSFWSEIEKKREEKK